MLVIATATGFDGQLRQPGDTFDLPDGSAGSWFKPVQQPDEGAVPAEVKAARARRRQQSGPDDPAA